MFLRFILFEALVTLELTFVTALLKRSLMLSAAFMTSLRSTIGVITGSRSSVISVISAIASPNASTDDWPTLRAAFLTSRILSWRPRANPSPAYWPSCLSTLDGEFSSSSSSIATLASWANLLASLATSSTLLFKPLAKPWAAFSPQSSNASLRSLNTLTAAFVNFIAASWTSSSCDFIAELNTFASRSL